MSNKFKKNNHKGIALLITIIIILVLTTTVVGSLRKRNRNMRLMSSKYDTIYFHMATRAFIRLIIDTLEKRKTLIDTIKEDIDIPEDYVKQQYYMYYLSELFRQGGLAILLPPDNHQYLIPKISDLSIIPINTRIPVRDIQPITDPNKVSLEQSFFLSRLELLIEGKNIAPDLYDVYNQVTIWQTKPTEGKVFTCEKPTFVERTGSKFNSLDEFRYVLSLCGIPLSQEEVYSNFRLYGKPNTVTINPNFTINEKYQQEASMLLESFSNAESNTYFSDTSKYPNFLQGPTEEFGRALLSNSLPNQSLESVNLQIQLPHLKETGPSEGTDTLLDLTLEPEEQNLLDYGEVKPAFFDINFIAQMYNFKQQVHVIVQANPEDTEIKILDVRIYTAPPVIKKKNKFGEGFHSEGFHLEDKKKT